MFVPWDSLLRVHGWGATGNCAARSPDHLAVHTSAVPITRWGVGEGGRNRVGKMKKLSALATGDHKPTGK